MNFGPAAPDRLEPVNTSRLAAGHPFSVIDTPIELFDRILAVDVRSMFLGLKYVIPEMMKSGGGSIVMTASTAALRGGPTIAPYVTSKHAVLGLMRATSSECAPLVMWQP